MSRQPGVYATFNTSEGTIVCRLFEKEAPVTVKNFIDLAEGTREWTDPRTNKKSNSPLYDGTIFHRVIPQFMIQGGDPREPGWVAPATSFRMKPRAHRIDSTRPASSQWLTPAPTRTALRFSSQSLLLTGLLDNHTIFGEVIEGQDVADKITALPRTRQDKPLKDVVLNSVKIERV